MANEFVGREFRCIEPDYIPYGQGYPGSVSPYRGCSVLGSNQEGIIDGAAYIREQYSYSFDHIWRSFGIIVGFWVFFIFLTSLGFELRNSQVGSSVLLYKRGSKLKRQGDEDKVVSRSPVDLGSISGSVNHSTFTWNELDYYVPFNGEKKQLLDKVFGFVKPGSLVALMGASGAGKTTWVAFRFLNSSISADKELGRLLDVLAQRKDSGEIIGSILIDGRPQGVSFQRTTGYCEQLDVHEKTATVREALVFSALLRQPSHVSYDEKVKYVDHIINLLELGDISDALIGGESLKLKLATLADHSKYLVRASASSSGNV